MDPSRVTQQLGVDEEAMDVVDLTEGRVSHHRVVNDDDDDIQVLEIVEDEEGNEEDEAMDEEVDDDEEEDVDEQLSSEEEEPPSPPPSPPRRYGSPDISLGTPRVATATGSSPPRSMSLPMSSPPRARTLDFTTVPRRGQSDSTDSDGPSLTVTPREQESPQDIDTPSNTTQDVQTRGAPPILPAPKVVDRFAPPAHLEPPFLPPPPPPPQHQPVTLEMISQLFLQSAENTRAVIENVQKTFMAEIQAVKMAQTGASQETSVGPLHNTAPATTAPPSSVSFCPPFLICNHFNSLIPAPYVGFTESHPGFVIQNVEGGALADQHLRPPEE